LKGCSFLQYENTKGICFTYELWKRVSPEVCVKRVAAPNNDLWTSLFELGNKGRLISQVLWRQAVKYLAKFSGEEYLSMPQNLQHCGTKLKK